MMFKKLLYFCAVILLSTSARAQLTASVCNSNECRFGSCEITSQTSYRCHCVAVNFYFCPKTVFRSLLSYS